MLTWGSNACIQSPFSVICSRLNAAPRSGMRVALGWVRLPAGLRLQKRNRIPEELLLKICRQSGTISQGTSHYAFILRTFPGSRPNLAGVDQIISRPDQPDAWD